MAGAVRPLCQARARANQLDRQGRIGDLDADRQVADGGDKHGETVAVGDQPTGRHAGTGAHHVRFRDADVDEALRESIAKQDSARRLVEVSVQDDDLWPLSAEFEQCLTIGVACLGHFCHLIPPP